jgi:cell wall assembly regulator SMI1
MSTASQLLERWSNLKQALALIDPRISDDFKPGADDAAIDRLRDALSVPLPPDLEALYRANDGAGRLGLDFDSEVAVFSVQDAAQASGSNGYFFMPIDGIDGVVSELETFAETMAEPGGPWMTRRGPVRPVPASTGWIPFAKDFGGNFLCLDLDPELGGNPGQVIEVAYDDSRLQVVAPSLVAFLADLAARCER